eukprot:255097-Chlamydomonas_euryale.AAC.1
MAFACRTMSALGKLLGLSTSELTLYRKCAHVHDAATMRALYQGPVRLIIQRGSLREGRHLDCLELPVRSVNRCAQASSAPFPMSFGMLGLSGALLLLHAKAQVGPQLHLQPTSTAPFAAASSDAARKHLFTRH